MFSEYIPRHCTQCGTPLVSRWIMEEERERLVCPSCRWIAYLNPKVAACTIPVDADGRILLVKRAIEPGYGLWVIPGGYVDLGETVREAAIRETYEETGVRVQLEQLVDAYSYPDSAVVVVVYAARMVEGTPQVGRECLDVALFDTRELPWQHLAFRSTNEALTDYLSSGNKGRRPV
ncbi:MAG TPA: NUDIX hydrolase [Sphingobacteriaceae bacterium]|nr:NUDIX hydrolase [Sphingobacteriaceae bacterium]